MVVIDELTENNLILFAAQNYRKPNFSDIEEFYEDLKRFKYVKRLINRYLEHDELAERLNQIHDELPNFVKSELENVGFDISDTELAVLD